MDQFGRGLESVDTEEGMQKIVKAMVERFHVGYSQEWQPLPYKKYTGYEIHKAGYIRCWWQYDGGHKRKREIPLIVEPYLPIGKRYQYVTLKDKRGNYINRAVYLLMARTFIGKQPAIGWRVYHWNGDLTDNRAFNLWWFPMDGTKRREAIDYWKLCRKGEE